MSLSLAAVPTGSMVDPCCCGCWSRFGDTMDVAVSGVVLCGCFSDTDPNPPNVTRYWNSSNLVGVNGVWTLNASAPGNPANTVWSADIGTVNLQEYDGPVGLCSTPIGDPILGVPVTLTINCFAEEGNGLIAQMGVPTGIGGVIVGAASQIYAQSGFFQPGDVEPNDVTCAVNELGYAGHVAGEGQLTVTPP